MDCNKDEALRAKDVAEKKMANNDFEGAQKMALKARNLFPELENISQILSVCDVHCSSKNRLVGSEKDWYGILQVEKFSSDLIVKKQYRRLALVLHPDKNQHPGAEAAFKLICEANAVLSDPVKKSQYDSRLRALDRYAPVNPPPHHIPTNSHFNKQFEDSKVSPHGFRPVNQHHAPRADTSIRVNTFWTLCPYCFLKYQYERRYLIAKLVCQRCGKNFTAYEIDPPVGTPGVPPNSGASHEKPNQCTQNNVNLRKQDPKRGTVSSVNLTKGGTRVSDGLKSGYEATATVSTSVGGKNTAKNQASRKQKDITTSSRTKAKISLVDSESSDSVKSSSDSDTEMTDAATGQDSGTTRVHYPRRSSRKRKSVSYNEREEENGDHDDIPVPKGSQERKLSEDGSVETEGSPNSEDIKPDIQDGFRVKEDSGHRKEKVREESSGVANHGDTSPDEEQDSGCDNDSDKNLHAPDPEFYDFDKDRDEECFTTGTYWACYDPEGMPRFYVRVDEVLKDPFKLHFTWLEAHPRNAYQKEWVSCDLPVGCGAFKFGDSETTSAICTFSHRVNVSKGKANGSLLLYPRKGEVWALFRDWDFDWTSDPENHRQYKYEVVEILGSSRDYGIRVVYLYKVEGFVSLFQRRSPSEGYSLQIHPGDLYRFSHKVPHCRMTGTEREGVPEGSLELDPAALPSNPNDMCYPGKQEMRSNASELEANSRGRNMKKNDNFARFRDVSQEKVIELDD